MEQEIRNLNINYNVNEENRIVEGRAIPFNVWSPNREGFRERIAPEAVEGLIDNNQDIFMLYNHDKSKGFLARNNKGKGTLDIEVREDGVYFSFKAKKDNLSKYVFERLVSGELDEMSWAFTVADDVWEKAPDGVYERTITRFAGLYDFSIVDNSYYGISNAVGCKRFAEIQEQERIENEKRIAEEEAKAEEEKKQQIKEYYDKIKDDYKDILNK